MKLAYKYEIKLMKYKKVYLKKNAGIKKWVMDKKITLQFC